jgi:predicted dithiol-disulfide oxidoreductase (DUF899 family)
MEKHKVVSSEEWLTARKEHLAKEKEFTRLRDQLSKERRELPWVKVEKAYVFDGPDGKESLADLFDGKSQLIVHLNHRDINLVAVSRAPLDKLETYRKRMGWSFKWVSSYGNDFNWDYNVSFTPEEMEKERMYYNYKMMSFPSDEGPGISVFYKNERDEIFHTYSCYQRGLDMLNGAYHYMDLAPKGRDEGHLPYTMAWLRRRDQYEE